MQVPNCRACFAPIDTQGSLTFEQNGCGHRFHESCLLPYVQYFLRNIKNRPEHGSPHFMPCPACVDWSKSNENTSTESINNLGKTVLNKKNIDLTK